MRAFLAEDLLRGGNTGAVDRTVEPPEIQGGVNRGLHALLIGYVGLHKTEVVSYLPTFEIRDDDVRPAGGEPSSSRCSQARASASDQEGASTDLHQLRPRILAFDLPWPMHTSCNPIWLICVIVRLLLS